MNTTHPDFEFDCPQCGAPVPVAVVAYGHASRHHADDTVSPEVDVDERCNAGLGGYGDDPDGLEGPCGFRLFSAAVAAAWKWQAGRERADRRDAWLEEQG